MWSWHPANALPAIGAALIATALLIAPLPASAGEPRCDETPPTVDKVARAVTAATRLERSLDGTGAQFAIIARVGSDLGRHGISYTHAGLVWRDDPAGRWQITHVLNDCGGSFSRLYRQGLMQFFLDDPVRYDALVLVPAPAMRDAMVARLASGAATTLHQPRYSALAYPYSTTYQNSNQFVLENLVLARAGMLSAGRDKAIDELQRSGFRPHVVRLTGFERLAGGFKANMRFDDHPRSAIEDNRYAVVTVDAIERWLAATGGLHARHELR